MINNLCTKSPLELTKYVLSHTSIQSNERMHRKRPTVFWRESKKEIDILNYYRELNMTRKNDEDTIPTFIETEGPVYRRGGELFTCISSYAICECTFLHILLDTLPRRKTHGCWCKNCLEKQLLHKAKQTKLTRIEISSGSPFLGGIVITTTSNWCRLMMWDDAWMR